MIRLTRAATLALLSTLAICVLAGCGPKELPAEAEKIPANIDPATGKERAK